MTRAGGDLGERTSPLVVVAAPTPQQTTELSDRSPHEWNPPAVTWVKEPDWLPVCDEACGLSVPLDRMAAAGSPDPAWDSPSRLVRFRLPTDDSDGVAVPH